MATGRPARMEAKAGFWSGAVWCPAQRSGRDHFQVEANTPLAMNPWGMFQLICESHQGCQESTDSFLSHGLNRKRKRHFSPLYLEELTAECPPALEERTKFIETAFPVMCGICYQPVASSMFPSWLFCCWAYNVSPGKALCDVSNVKCRLWKRRQCLESDIS